MTPFLGSVVQFHEAVSYGTIKHYFGVLGSTQDTEFTYTFENFFHPFVGELITQLNRNSLPGMLDPNFLQGLNESPAATFFDTFYTTLTSDVVKIK